MLREATDADVDQILKWRNHPQVRSVSLTTHEISPDEHHAWWKAVSDDPTRKVLIYEREQIPSGVVTLVDMDPEEKSAVWGFYVDIDGLEARGELLPAWFEVMSQAVRYAFDEAGLEVLRGEVLAINEVVRRMNRRYGFVETSSYRRTVGDQEQEVICVELQAANRKRA